MFEQSSTASKDVVICVRRDYDNMMPIRPLSDKGLELAHEAHGLKCCRDLIKVCKVTPVFEKELVVSLRPKNFFKTLED